MSSIRAPPVIKKRATLCFEGRGVGYGVDVDKGEHFARDQLKTSNEVRARAIKTIMKMHTKLKRTIRNEFIPGVSLFGSRQCFVIYVVPLNGSMSCNYVHWCDVYTGEVVESRSVLKRYINNGGGTPQFFGFPGFTLISARIAYDSFVSVVDVHGQCVFSMRGRWGRRGDTSHAGQLLDSLSIMQYNPRNGNLYFVVDDGRVMIVRMNKAGSHSRPTKFVRGLDILLPGSVSTRYDGMLVDPVDGYMGFVVDTNKILILDKEHRDMGVFFLNMQMDYMWLYSNENGLWMAIRTEGDSELERKSTMGFYRLIDKRPIRIGM